MVNSLFKTQKQQQFQVYSNNKPIYISTGQDLCIFSLAGESSHLAMLIGLTFQAPLISGSLCGSLCCSQNDRSTINTVALQRSIVVINQSSFPLQFQHGGFLVWLLSLHYIDVLKHFGLGIFLYLLFIYSLSFPRAATMWVFQMTVITLLWDFWAPTLSLYLLFILLWMNPYNKINLSAF